MDIRIYFVYFDIDGGDKKKDFDCALRDGIRIFNRRDANRLLDEFVEHFRDGMDLMVHCRYGMNRSAGIAVALNYIFHLGHDYLPFAHQRFDQHAYSKIGNAAIFRGLVNRE